MKNEEIKFTSTASFKSRSAIQCNLACSIHTSCVATAFVKTTYHCELFAQDGDSTLHTTTGKAWIKQRIMVPGKEVTTGELKSRCLLIKNVLVLHTKDPKIKSNLSV